MRDDRDAELDGTVDDLLALTRVLVGLTARTLASQDTDLTLPQYRMLVFLTTNGPLRATDLATELRLHPSTVTRTCDRLVRRGLILRHHAGTDRRTVRLALTEHGRDLVGHVMRQRAIEIRRLVRAAADAGPADLAHLLRAVIAIAGEPSEAEWWRRWSVAGRSEAAPSGG